MAAILFKWCLLTSLAFYHPFYVSVTEINHNAKDKALEISCKLFAEDLEKTLEKQYKIDVDITHPKNKEQTNKMVSDYLLSHLQLKVDGKPVKLEFVGFEKESEAAWCYLQVQNVTGVKKMEITNKLLYETYDTEINLMHVTVGGIRKSNKLSYPDQETVFEF